VERRSPAASHSFATNAGPIDSRDFGGSAKSSSGDFKSLKRRARNSPCGRIVWALDLHAEQASVAFKHDPHRPVRGKKGAHVPDGMGRSDPPLRGKLGRMTLWSRLGRGFRNAAFWGPARSQAEPPSFSPVCCSISSVVIALAVIDSRPGIAS
jgi:hypothetical protein